MAGTATEGIPFPSDFDAGLHERLFRKAEAKHSCGHPDSFMEFNTGLMGLVYRFTACSEHDDFCSISLLDAAPPMPKRYFQEKELFGFFVTALSSIECFAYAGHMMGSWADSATFVLTQQGLKNVSPEKTADLFQQ